MAAVGFVGVWRTTDPNWGLDQDANALAPGPELVVTAGGVLSRTSGGA